VSPDDQQSHDNQQQQTEQPFDPFDALGKFLSDHDYPHHAVEDVMDGYDLEKVYTPHRRWDVESKNPILAQKLAAALEEELAKKAADRAADEEKARLEALDDQQRDQEEARIAAEPEPISDEESRRLFGVGHLLHLANNYSDAWDALPEADREQLPRLGFNAPFRYTPKEATS
jgi:hypothetical protein